MLERIAENGLPNVDQVVGGLTTTAGHAADDEGRNAGERQAGGSELLAVPGLAAPAQRVDTQFQRDTRDDREQDDRALGQHESVIGRAARALHCVRLARFQIVVARVHGPWFFVPGPLYGRHALEAGTRDKGLGTDQAPRPMDEAPRLD